MNKSLLLCKRLKNKNYIEKKKRVKDSIARVKIFKVNFYKQRDNLRSIRDKKKISRR